MARIRFGCFERLCMWLMAARLSCCLLRAGALRGTACLRSASTPSSGFGALLRRLRAVRGRVEDFDLGSVLGEPVLGQSGAVGLQSVQDQEHPSAGLPDQAPEEA